MNDTIKVVVPEKVGRGGYFVLKNGKIADEESTYSHKDVACPCCLVGVLAWAIFRHLHGDEPPDDAKINPCVIDAEHRLKRLNEAKARVHHSDIRMVFVTQIDDNDAIDDDAKRRLHCIEVLSALPGVEVAA